MENPFLHSKNFWIIEWLTLEEVRNNLNKYCSFTDTFINEIEIKKKLFNLRKLKYNWYFYKNLKYAQNKS